MENAKIEQMVRSVLAHELNVDAASIGEETSVENMPLWDSVKHVDIIFGIQDAFGIELDHLEVEYMLSYPQIVDVLVRRFAQPSAN